MVRVVSIGIPVEELLKNPADPKWRQYSIEFCGGTHLTNSSEAQRFVIISEESVSKGIRRIVALSGEAASAAGQLAQQIDHAIAQGRAAKDEELPSSMTALQKVLTTPGVPLLAKRRGQTAVAELQQRHKAYEKTAKASGASSGVDAVALAGELLAAAPALGPGKLVIGEIAGASDDQLRSALDSLKKRQPSLAALLASAADGKVTFIAAVSDDLIARGLKAGDWVREVAKAAGGGGGGRPQMAQAGGKDPAKMADALETAKKVATSAVK